MKKGWMTVCALLLAAEMLSGGRISAAAAKRLQLAAESGELAAVTLSLELGSSGTVITAAADRPAEPSAAPAPLPTPQPTPSPVPTLSPVPSPTPPPTLTPLAEAETAVFPDIAVTNRSSRDVDIHALMRETPDVHLPAASPQILIIHTHGTEAYTMSAGSEYSESDEYRTTDTNYNVVKLGELLQQELSAQGLHVIHDRGLYDYPSYTGSYDRSAAAVEQWLQQYPGISVVIDLHRDALGSGDAVYKTRAELSAEPSAQVMLLIGTGENGLAHPRWQENFKLALQLQEAMNKTAPTLARPIDLVAERYNQHYTTGSMILEVGSSGNTLPEAMCAVRLFARAAGPVFLSLVEPRV